ncbi:MAG: mechanosensitive ion channel family protein [Gemmatimonadaceae bacterium]
MQTELTTNAHRSMSDIGQWFALNQSRLVTALVLLVVGALLAILLRALAVRIVSAVDRAMPGHDFRTSFAGFARERHVSVIVGAVVFWGVLLFFTATAADALGLPLLSSAVASISDFVPRVLGAVLILVTGLVIGGVARSAVTAAAAGAGTSFAPGLGQIVRIAIIIAAALIAVAEMGVDITLLTAIFSVALAAMLGGFAIAFGLGARTAVSNIIGSHYLRQTYEVGQTVSVGGIEGTIAELTSTSVILNAAEGRVVVPAKQFGEMPSTLIVKGGAS